MLIDPKSRILLYAHENCDTIENSVPDWRDIEIRLLFVLYPVSSKSSVFIILWLPSIGKDDVFETVFLKVKDIELTAPHELVLDRRIVRTPRRDDFARLSIPRRVIVWVFDRLKTFQSFEKAYRLAL